MPISTPQIHALNSLKSLKTSPYEPEFDSSDFDPNSQRLKLAQEMEDELEGRMFSNQRAQAASVDPAQSRQYGGEVTALKNMLGAKRDDIAANPLTAQRGQVEDYLGQEREAISQGFGGGAMGRGTDQVQYQNPIQARAGYGRAQEQAKLNMPLRVQEAQSQGELGKQRVASQGALDVAKEQSRGGLDIQKNFTDFQQSLSQGQPGQPARTPQSVTAPGRYGGGTINYGSASSRLPKAVPPAVTQAITKARRDYELAQQQEGMWSGSGTSQALKATLDQAIAAGIYNYPADDPVNKQFIQFILNDPQAKDLPLDQILQMKGETDVTPDEYAEMQEMLNLFRGF